MSENKIATLKEAEDYLLNAFGEPDYFSRPEDIADVEEYLNDFRSEAEKLQRYVNNTSYENMNQFKINRCIALHFLLEAGDKYLQRLHDSVYNNHYEEELELVDEIVDDYWPEYPEEDDETNFGNSDYWERP